MSVQFEEPRITQESYVVPQAARAKQGFLTSFLIKKGIARSKADADKIMVGIAMVFFALSLYFFFF